MFICCRQIWWISIFAAQFFLSFKIIFFLSFCPMNIPYEIFWKKNFFFDKFVGKLFFFEKNSMNRNVWISTLKKVPAHYWSFLIGWKWILSFLRLHNLKAYSGIPVLRRNIYSTAYNKTLNSSLWANSELSLFTFRGSSLEMLHFFTNSISLSSLGDIYIQPPVYRIQAPPFRSIFPPYHITVIILTCASLFPSLFSVQATDIPPITHRHLVLPGCSGVLLISGSFHNICCGYYRVA